MSRLDISESDQFRFFSSGLDASESAVSNDHGKSTDTWCVQTKTRDADDGEEE